MFIYTVQLYLLYFVVFLLASVPTQTSLEAIFTSDLSGEIAYVYLKQCTWVLYSHI